MLASVFVGGASFRSGRLASTAELAGGLGLAVGAFAAGAGAAAGGGRAPVLR